LLPLHAETSNLAHTGLLMNTDHTPEIDHPDLLCLGHQRIYLYVYYFCKLLTYSHKICASDMFAPTFRFTPDLAYFWGYGSKCEKTLLVSYGGTIACTQTLVILCAQTYQETLTIHQKLSLWVNFRVKITHGKLAWVGIFKPAEPHNSWVAVFIYCWLQCCCNAVCCLLQWVYFSWLLLVL